MDLLKSLKNAHSKGKTEASTSSTPRIAELDDNGQEIKVEEEPVHTAKTLRVHAIYMDKRRHFEVRRKEDGGMELWDVDAAKALS